MTLTDASVESKREAVLRAALSLIDEFGFHGTSMAAIADEANVGAGTIYRYFDGKEDLINELYAEARAEAHRLILEMGHGDDKPVRDRLHAFWRAALLNYIECPKLYRFILQYESSPYLRESTRAQVEDMKEPFRRLYREGVDEGLFRDDPHEVHAAFFTGAASHLVQFHLIGEIELDDAMIDRTFDMIWAASTS